MSFFVSFPQTTSPFSATCENEWRSHTNAHFSHVPPTSRMLGRVTADISDTRNEKDPCSFLKLFQSFSRGNAAVQNHLKCTLDKDNVPHLEAGSKKVRVDSASVSRLYRDDETSVDVSELEVWTNNPKPQTYSCIASGKKVTLSKVVNDLMWTLGS